MFSTEHRVRHFHLTLRGLCEVFRTTSERWMNEHVFAEAWHQVIGDELPGMAPDFPGLWATLRYLEQRELVQIRETPGSPREIALTALCPAYVAWYEPTERATERREYDAAMKEIARTPTKRK